MKICADYITDQQSAIHSTLDVALLVKLLVEQGIEPLDVLAGSSISTDDLANQDVLVSFQQKLSVFENVVRLSRDPAIGLHAGREVRFSDFGIFGYAVISSATVGQAIEIGIKYLQLAGPVLRKCFSVEGNNACFEGKDPISLGPLLPFAIEFWFSSIQALCSEVLGQNFPSRLIKLPYAAPAYANEYTTRFECPIEFNTDVIEWHFDAALLELPTPNANPLTAKMCIRTCDSMLADIVQKDDLIHQIRYMLLEAPGRFPDIEVIAARHCLSSRTLRRKLKSLGSSYQRILDDTRKDLAIEYLQNTQLTIEEIAERVGFTEASNFRAAFRKWTGWTPSQIRRD